MQARTYHPLYGRFLEPDPIVSERSRLTNSNWLTLFQYVSNNPIVGCDPDGKRINLSRLTIDQRDVLLREWSELSGLQLSYDFNENNVKIGDNGVTSGGSFHLAVLISGAASKEMEVNFYDRSFSDQAFGYTRGTNVGIDFEDFNRLNIPENLKGAYGLGWVTLHELYHATTGKHDLEIGGWAKNGTGPVVDFMNRARLELGVPIRKAYFVRKSNNTIFIPFVDKEGKQSCVDFDEQVLQGKETPLFGEVWE